MPVVKLIFRLELEKIFISQKACRNNVKLKYFSEKSDRQAKKSVFVFYCSGEKDMIF